MPQGHLGRAWAWPFLLVAALPAAATADDGPVDFFESKIRPLLVEKCLSCHGDEQKKGGLSLSSREAILEGGESGPSAVPGSPDESLLIDALQHDTEPRMPPKGKLPDADIQAITRWVELGMPWGPESSKPTAAPATTPPAATDHWAFQPVRSVSPPDVGNSTWPRNEIDRFVLSKLTSAGLSPSPEADRRTLIRRLSYDLIGLPPAPEDVAAFVSDPSPDAYERLVDRLLADPRYGEQWARHWLDVARYSDTKGYVYAREEARWIHSAAYRDWVVRAWNDALPYDRFLTLQIAADQVADRPEELPAMGFLTLGRRFLGVTHDIIDDRIDVVTRGTLGLTVACARCHDHKFDPIPTADYYSLYGVFKSSSERVLPATSQVPTEGEFASGLAERQAKLDDRMKKERDAAASRSRQRVGEYLLAQLEMQKYPEEGFDQILAETDIIPASVRLWRDVLARARLSGDPIFRAWHAFLSLPPSEFSNRAPDVTKSLADSSNPLIARAFSTPPADPADVARRYGEVFSQVIQQWESARAADASLASLPDPDAEAIRRLLYGPDSACEVPDEPIVETESYFPSNATTELWKLQGDLDRWVISRGDASPFASVLVDRPHPLDARILRRGNPATPGDAVPRHFLSVLSSNDPKPFDSGSGRLELAKAIVDPTNPLTSRVIVNRVWLHLFGSGLVRTPGDFGTRAEPPTHPDLLDWLAHRLVSNGWDLKDLQRRLVLSSAYRQSSSGPADRAVLASNLAADPENRLLWRHSAHRLSFEELRDSFLTVSGDLTSALGSRPAELLRPPFPVSRTLYGLVNREDLPSVLRSFDFPNPDLLVPQRNESTIPQQSLFLMNHPFLLDRAEAIVRRIDGTDDQARVRSLYRLAYGRDPSPSESSRALALVGAEHASPMETRPATAADWSYGIGRYDEPTGRVADFAPLPYFTGEAWQGGPAWPDPTHGWAQLTAAGGHPGNDRAHASVRRWTAPRDCTIRVTSTVAHQEAQGDGIRAFVVSSRVGLLASAVLHNSTATLGAESIEVTAGETIDFVVDIGDGLNSDQHLWAPVVEEISPGRSRWDASSDFGGPAPKPLGPWELLAQVLLMSNEFSFVD